MDPELKEAIREGISRTKPDPILTEEVIAAHRLPLPLSRMTAICQAAPRDARMQQRGEWIVIIDPQRKEVKP